MSRGRDRTPSQRQLRVGELLRHDLAQLLNAGRAHDPELFEASITVSEVRVSPDLKAATAFVLPLGGRDEKAILAALRRAAPFFRRELARAANLRFAPRLGFQLDHSFEQAERVERRLRDERVRQDLQPAHEGDKDGRPS